MTKPKANPKPIGKYDRSAEILVKRWWICLRIAQAYHRSAHDAETLLLTAESLEKINLNLNQNAA